VAVGFFQFVHNTRQRGKALLGALVAALVMLYGYMCSWSSMGQILVTLSIAAPHVSCTTI
jgi:hypothetical protein